MDLNPKKKLHNNKFTNSKAKENIVQPTNFTKKIKKPYP